MDKLLEFLKDLLKKVMPLLIDWWNKSTINKKREAIHKSMKEFLDKMKGKDK